MQLLLREEVSLFSFPCLCLQESLAKKNVCNARDRYKEIRPAQ